MKKFLKGMSMTLAAVLLSVSVAACGGGTQNTTTGGTTVAGGETTSASPETTGGSSTSGKKVHVFYYDYSDTYIASVRDAMDQAWKAAGIANQNNDGQNNQTTQSEQVTTAVQDADLLVVNYVQTAAADPAIEIVNQAKEAGIPVIFFNREVTDELINSYDKAVFVGTKAIEAGQLQGKMVGDYVLANFDALDLNGDGKISYAMFKGEQGNNESELRTQYGVEDADKILTAAGKPALEYFDQNNASKYQVDPNGRWSAQAAFELMQTNLASYSEANNNMIELVIANNDGMAEGAISALNAAGYNTGGDKKIPVFGVDATDAAKTLIAENKMTGTVMQDAVGMADTIVQIAQNMLEGKDMLDGVTSPVDASVAKVRIPYQEYTGK